MLSPDHFGFSGWYSGQIDQNDRRTFLEQIVKGHVAAAYRGHNVVYAHAGSPTPYNAETVNDRLIEATETLLGAINSDDCVAVQRRILEDYSSVLGVGDAHLKGSGAGLVWLDFSHLPADAPHQVVGHTCHATPQQKGNVFCQNVLRKNLDSEGGEAVFVETPQALSALTRRPDGSAEKVELYGSGESLEGVRIGGFETGKITMRSLSGVGLNGSSAHSAPNRHSHTTRSTARPDAVRRFTKAVVRDLSDSLPP